jgi:hypothetical protein
VLLIQQRLFRRQLPRRQLMQPRLLRLLRLRPLQSQSSLSRLLRLHRYLFRPLQRPLYRRPQLQLLLRLSQPLRFKRLLRPRW